MTLATETNAPFVFCMEDSTFYFRDLAQPNGWRVGVLSAQAPIVRTGNIFSILVASASQAGALSAADFASFAAKQPALDFTPENVANKSTNTSLGTSNTFYPSQNAVKVYADTKEPVITAGTISQYWRGDKTWRDFGTDIAAYISANVATIKTALGLATVATSGSYNDLSNKPTIPAAQIQSDWTQASTGALDYIKNKPTIPPPALGGSFVQAVPLIVLGGLYNFNVTVAGAALGMVSDVDPQPNGSFLANLSNCRSVVTAANTVTIYLSAGVAIGAGNQTFSVRVIQ